MSAERILEAKTTNFGLQLLLHKKRKLFLVDSWPSYTFSLNSYRCFPFVIPAPLCPTPPLPPPDGFLINNPKVFGPEIGRVCGVNSQQTYIKCPSFLNIYIQSATIGRNPASGTVLCNGTSGKKSVGQKLLIDWILFCIS
jgi:hypothetical protein